MVVFVKRIFKIFMFEIIRTAGVSRKFVSFKFKSAFVCNEKFYSFVLSPAVVLVL